MNPEHNPRKQSDPSSNDTERSCKRPRGRAEDRYAVDCPQCDVEFIGATVDDLETHIRDEHPEQIDPKGAATLHTLLAGEVMDGDTDD